MRFYHVGFHIAKDSQAMVLVQGSLGQIVASELKSFVANISYNQTGVDVLPV